MPLWLIPMISSLIPFFTGALNNSTAQNSQATNTASNNAMQQLIPSMTSLFQDQANRMSAADPLYNMILRMAAGRLPTWVTGTPIAGTGLSSTSLPGGGGSIAPTPPGVSNPVNTSLTPPANRTVTRPASSGLPMGMTLPNPNAPGGLG